jgi:hypothetical protein
MRYQDGGSGAWFDPDHRCAACLTGQAHSFRVHLGNIAATVASEAVGGDLWATRGQLDVDRWDRVRRETLDQLWGSIPTYRTRDGR